jgi:hypothetical protein
MNGASPSGRGYVLKIRLSDNTASEIPIDVNWKDSDTVPFNLPANITDQPGQLPKVEAWVERSVGAITKKVSNTISTK